MLALCIANIFAMLRRDDGRYLMLGVTALFSIGYYVLPVFFKGESGLDRFSNEAVAVAIAMALLFFAFFSLGAVALTQHFSVRRFKGLYFSSLDSFYLRFSTPIFIICFVIWVSHFLSGGLTSYSAENFEAFFHERSPLAGLLAAFAGFALTAMAVTLSMHIRLNKKRSVIWMSMFYASSIILLLSSGQRLAVITPIFTLVAALAVFGNQKLGIRLIFVGIAILMVVSPFMVFVREFQGAVGQEKILAASSEYSLGGGDIFAALLISIMQRADLLAVAIHLKDYIDATGFVAGHYYPSIIYSFVPRFIYPEKPYPLSDDGTLWGELSVVAWTLLKGHTTGSLTAFGAISAYREGGWLWVPINGLFAGASFALIFAWLGRGGVVARWLFCSIFVTACIKNVPPSFFQLWVYLASSVLTLLALFLLNKLMKIFILRQ